jgi:hypothetical protein
MIGLNSEEKTAKFHANRDFFSLQSLLKANAGSFLFGSFQY